MREDDGLRGRCAALVQRLRSSPEQFNGDRAANALEQAVFGGAMGWIGVDLDSTLAHYESWEKNGAHIGDPIPAMAERVRAWLEAGKDVRIFTARATLPERLPPIREWCLKHFGQALPITNVKDFSMVELWDDRAVAVEANTGRRLSPEPSPWVSPYAAHPRADG